MKTFISDLWSDLREKRLWPVAVLLLAGLVAVPVVLKKSSEDVPPAPPTASAPREAPEPRELKGLATVKLEEGDTEDGSSLDTFDPANPFQPPAKVVKESEESTGVGTGVGPADGGVLLFGGDEGSTGTTGGGDTGGGDTGGTGDTGGGDGGTTTKTTQYAYVIDVTFTANGRTRKIKGMEKLDMLPNPASPLLLFLGVSANAGNAVFLVDSTLSAAGEGQCKPTRAECAFLYLGAGSEHEFTNEDGDSYQLKVDQIRKVQGPAGRRRQALPGTRASRPARRSDRPPRGASCRPSSPTS